MDIARHFDPHTDLAAALLQGLSPNPADTAHDVSHVLRVWQNVRRITDVEGGDMRILTASTLLHDAVHVAKDSPQRRNASRLAAAAATRRLQALAWHPRDVGAVAHTIEAHSFSANIPPETLEARILQDADRLDALGHIGIARCFAVSGALARALYDPADPHAKHRELNDTAFALDHFQTKLLQLAAGFQTPTGRKLAAARHSVLERFLQGFLDEVSPAPPLR